MTSGDPNMVTACPECDASDITPFGDGHKCQECSATFSDPVIRKDRRHTKNLHAVHNVDQDDVEAARARLNIDPETGEEADDVDP